MEWENILYGKIVKTGNLFVIQKCGDLYSLWIAEGLPDSFNDDGVSAYIEDHDLDGSSFTGTFEDVARELYGLLD